jgi:hypothetical protein
MVCSQGCDKSAYAELGFQKRQRALAKARLARFPEQHFTIIYLSNMSLGDA